MNSRRFLLNIAPVSFSDAEVKIGMLPYRDEAQLRELRKAHNGTHVFRRESGTMILCCPVSGGDDIGDEFVQVKLSDKLRLCADLIRDSLITHLNTIQRLSDGFDPVRFLGGANDNLLATAVPGGAECPPWLGVRPSYEARVRVFRWDERPPFVGLTLDVRTTVIIGANCSELLAQGIPLTGLYVGRIAAPRDRRLRGRLELAGRVRSVDGDQLLLDDARPGLERVMAAEVFLEPRREALTHCMDLVFGAAAVATRKALASRIQTVVAGKARLSRIETVRKYFSQSGLEMLPGVGLSFGQFLGETGGALPPISEAGKAVYVFDQAGRNTSTWHDDGLDRYGPYTGQTFTPTRPRVCVICQAARKGQVEQFLHKFLNGCDYVRRGRTPFAKGFVRKYAIEGITTEFFTTNGSTADAYHAAVRKALSRQSELNARWDLALVQIDERFHTLRGEQNPYLVTKAAFLSQQIPTQEFEIETAQFADNQLAYSLNNMALATYAKLGGVPWLVKANPTIAHELVVGMGSASVGDGRLGDREKVVGITTVFSGDGRYWLSNVSKAVPFKDYGTELLDSLRATFERARHDMNWQPQQHVRLIFHASKPLKDAEADAAKSLASGLASDFDLDFAFVHVDEGHPFVLFDTTQEGVEDYETRTMKGTFAPTRGTFLRLSDHEVLIALTGAREVKRPEDGLPRPLLLRLHRASTFRDTTYLARQLFVFSCHSWRSFFPSPVPVTVLYSRLIARMLGQLSTLSRWNPDALIGRMGESRWFL